MNKITKIASLGLLSGAIVFSAASFAHMNNDDDSDRRNCNKGEYRDGKWVKGELRAFGKIKHALRHLDLSEEQETQIDAIMDGVKPAMKSMRQAMKDSRETLRALMKTSEYDEEAVLQAANDQANLMAQKLVLMAQTKAELFKVLTPEQQEELNDRFESRKHY